MTPAAPLIMNLWADPPGGSASHLMIVGETPGEGM
jgi:hypothetical protein